MIKLATLSASKLADQLGVPESICTVVRMALLRRDNTIEVRLGGARPWLCLELAQGYQLDLTGEGIDLTLSGHDGGFPGCQYFYYVLQNVRTGKGHSQLVDAKGVETITIAELPTRLHAGLEELYVAIGKTRLILDGPPRRRPARTPPRPKRHYK